MSGLFQVGYLGNSGVGKSSLLAAMWQQLRNASETRESVFLSPKDETRKRLSSAWEELRRVSQVGEFKQPAGTAGTAQTQAHEFQLILKQAGMANHEIASVEFVDSRGGDLVEKQKDLVDRLDHARALLIVVDTPKMMEFSVEQAQDAHQVTHLKDLLEELLDRLPKEAQLLLLFVAVKSERYFADEALDKVSLRLHDVFKPLRKRLGGESGRVTSAAYAVKTVSNVLFKFKRMRVDVPKGTPPAPANCEMIYASSPKNSAPEFADVPMRRIVKHLLETVRREKGWWQSVNDWWTGHDSIEADALKDFAREPDSACRLSDPL